MLARVDVWYEGLSVAVELKIVDSSVVKEERVGVADIKLCGRELMVLIDSLEIELVSCFSDEERVEGIERILC